MGSRALVSSLACALLMSAALSAVEANCKIKNDSSKKVIIIPVEVDVTIEVDVGATVELPPAQQNCYFKNPATGHKKGPVKLKDKGTYVSKTTVKSLMDFQCFCFHLPDQCHFGEVSSSAAPDQCHFGVRD
ncbi:hypothetical protein KP509_1Z094700 [Ceratopteris richardii]|nr:hypothetical protein KP509_1Z094700 [Ceratopteris richardii]